MEKKRNAYRILMVRAPGRPIHRRLYIIKMDVRAIGWAGADSIDVSRDKDQ
jgi:hypothetical protein